MFIFDWFNKLPPLQQIGLLLALGFLLLCIYLFAKAVMYRKQPKDVVNESQKSDKEPNTIVLDQEKGKLYKFVDWGKTPPARQFRENNKYYYLIKRPRGVLFPTVAEALKYVVLTHAEQWISDGVITEEEKKERMVTPEVLKLALVDNYSPIVWASPAPKWANGIQKGMIIIAVGLLLVAIVFWGKGPSKPVQSNQPTISQTK